MRVLENAAEEAVVRRGAAEYKMAVVMWRGDIGSFCEQHAVKIHEAAQGDRSSR